MKQMVVCCDGTWNDRERMQGHETSVARISTQLETDKKRGRTGVEPWYIKGVGANPHPTPALRLIDKLRGGALARGLTADLSSAYAFVCALYEPGDEILVFGYSRGAYTARSLAGLIRAAGIPPGLDRARVLELGPDHDWSDHPVIKQALDWYRNEEKPWSNASLKFRLAFSPDFYTTPEEATWRATKPQPQGAPINIAYLGIFDTVGTVGIPGVLGKLGWVPEDHGFHDLDLSSLVKAGRHAVGLMKSGCSTAIPRGKTSIS